MSVDYYKTYKKYKRKQKSYQRGGASSTVSIAYSFDVTPHNITVTKSSGEPTIGDLISTLRNQGALYGNTREAVCFSSGHYEDTPLPSAALLNELVNRDDQDGRDTNVNIYVLIKDYRTVNIHHMDRTVSNFRVFGVMFPPTVRDLIDQVASETDAPHVYQIGREDKLSLGHILVEGNDYFVLNDHPVQGE